MQKLSDAQSRVLIALLGEQTRASEAIREYVRFVGAGLENPVVRQMPDGFYVMEDPREKEEADGKDV